MGTSDLKARLAEKDLDHQHHMDKERHQLLVTGQRWAGGLATIGVLGSVIALLLGRDGVASAVMTAEFVSLIGLFLYRKRSEGKEGA